MLAAYAAAFPAVEPHSAWSGSIASCDPGAMPDAVRRATFHRINYFRAMAGVPAEVVEDTEFSRKAQSAALVMAANGDLSHDPPSSWRCWSEDAHDGASHSNLHLGFTSPTAAITSFMNDQGANNAAVGHRDWLLRPTQTRMGVGTADNATAVWVVDEDSFFDDEAEVRDPDGFVSWPPPGFVPWALAFPRWSVHRTLTGFDDVTVEVAVNGTPVAAPVEWRAHEVVVFGPDLPDAASVPVDVDTVVDVTVRGVTINGEETTHSWTTRLIHGPFSATERFLIEASLDFTGAAPTLQTLYGLAGTANASGRRAALQSLASSDAWLGSVVDGFYRSILQRSADAVGRQHWIDQFRSGRETTTSMAAGFYASDEYFGRAGGSVAAWVETLYREILGRASDPGGHAGWVDATARSGRQAVATAFYQSPESLGRRVGALYGKFLGRSPDETGLRTWTEQIGRTGNDIALALDLASSDEYFIRTSG